MSLCRSDRSIESAERPTAFYYLVTEAKCGGAVELDGRRPDPSGRHDLRRSVRRAPSHG